MLDGISAHPLLWVTGLIIMFSLIETRWEQVRPAGNNPAQRVAANFATYLAGATLVAGIALLTRDMQVGWQPPAYRFQLRAMLGLSPLAVVLAYAAMRSLADYWLHRANHCVPVLWRFHRVHHSDPGLDATTTLRSHPGELVLTGSVQLAVAAMVGASPETVIGYALAVMGWSVWTHSLLGLARFQFPRPLHWLVSPAFHALHHSSAKQQTDSNYATVFAGWDLLFGSYLDPRRETIERIGLGDAFDNRGSWRDQLLLPFSPPQEIPNAIAAGAQIPERA